MQSFWELDQLTTQDISIIGGGILGLFTAYELSEKYPKARIALYERSPYTAGATSRNAGFACFGSISEINADRKLWGNDIALKILSQRWLGIQRIYSLLGSRIDYEKYGGYELMFESETPSTLLDEMNDYLFPLFNEPVFSFQQDRINEFGFGKDVKNLIYNHFEGQIHSGKLVLALHEILRQKNVQYFANSEVTSYTGDSSIEFSVNNRFVVKTNKLIFCTNAFLPHGNLKVKPARGQILITKPIPELSFKGCFHFQEGFYYFRNVGNRILFGGGRNLDLEGEMDSQFLLNKVIQEDLIAKLNTIIAPKLSPKIEMQWSGIMAFSENKLPLIEKIDENIIYAMNCNGMGVSLSPITAQEISRMI